MKSYTNPSGQTFTGSHPVDVAILERAEQLDRELRAAIAAVHASEFPALGLTRNEAIALMDRIVETGMTDDDALAAYDLLHRRATTGRAW